MVGSTATIAIHVRSSDSRPIDLTFFAALNEQPLYSNGGDTPISTSSRNPTQQDSPASSVHAQNRPQKPHVNRHGLWAESHPSLGCSIGATCTALRATQLYPSQRFGIRIRGGCWLGRATSAFGIAGVFQDLGLHVRVGLKHEVGKPIEQTIRLETKNVFGMYYRALGDRAK